MKTAIILFLIYTSAFAQTKPIIYVLSSLNIKNAREMRSFNYVKDKIEHKITNSSLNRNFDFKIVHETTPAMLWNSLQDSNAVAIMWISHSKPQEKFGNNVTNPSYIQNFTGYNVADLFQKVSPNLKFLSVVGCKNRNIFEDLKKTSNYPKDLIIDTFESKTDIYAGFAKSFSKLEWYFRNYQEAPMPIPNLSVIDTIRIHGLSKIKGNELKIKLGSIVLGAFVINEDYLEIQITNDILNNSQNRNLNIELYKEDQLPELEIFSENFRWSALKINNKLVGFNRGLYLPTL